ncbi:MAG: cob(I)yrinic acid a,c-diamide adenosyltransferase [Patescibacteria group bacterium]
MSIVTKTGDKGETGLYNGERVKKSDPRMEALGDIDELSSQLGFLQAPEIQKLQRDLFELGALVGNPDGAGNMTAALAALEKEVEILEPTLPPLHNFILPGGHPAAARLHLARAVCRRAERHLSILTPLPADALPYLNRLSDYLFLLGRQANLKNGVPEILWSATMIP